MDGRPVLRRPFALGTILFFVLVVAVLTTAVLVVRARTPDLVLEVTQPPANHPATLRTGGEPPRSVEITFFVRESDPHALVGIVDSEENLVRTLDGDVALDEDDPVTYTWDGRTDAGALRAVRALPAARRPAGRAPRDDLAATDHRVHRRQPDPRTGSGMNTSAIELIGILIACGAAAVALVAEDRRARQAAMVVALIAAPVLVLGDVWDESRVVDFRHSPAQLGGAVVVGAIALALLAAAFRRRPEWFAIAAFAVLPLRVPVEIGGETANLLVPLYLVIGSGVIASILSGREPNERTTNDERLQSLAQTPALAARRHRRPLRHPIGLLGRRPQRDREHRLLSRSVLGPLRPGL